ncbi:MAG: tRNA (adenosine(37)-N6)-dimethylallyltransferase MiaA [Arcticibacter sp.]
MNSNTLIVVAGPTAIGKTDLAIKIALNYRTEVVSADSRQFYKEMSIGTAKPNEAETAAVKHHFVDSISIDQTYSAGKFETEALSTLENIFQKQPIAVLVGGSGLFVKAVTEGFDEFPDVDPVIRETLNRKLTEEGIAVLQSQLKSVDPAYASEVDLDNPQRIIRALEVCLSTGQPYSSFRAKNARNKRHFSPIKIGLNMERPQLYDRINRRVDLMMEQGLLQEVERLLPYRNLNALNTVGYTEIFDHLDGKITLDEAVERIKQNTRRFAKRQLTWFRKDSEITWFHPDDYPSIISFIDARLKAA